MTVYSARAVIVATSACRERSAGPYRGRGRPPRRSASPAADGTFPRTGAEGAVLPRTKEASGALPRIGAAEGALPRSDAAGTLPRTEAAARRADALARSLCGARDRLAMPLACIAASLVRERAWCTFGFARAADFAREHFGCSGRWLRDLAALHHALSAIQGLAAALTGDDGGAPLGRRRVLLVARVATAATLPAWLALARRLSVRELQAAVAQARKAADAPPSADAPPPDTVPPQASPARSPEGAPDPDADGADVCEDRSLVRIAVPRAVVAAFDEAVDLYRVVEGSEATVTS